MGQPKAAHSARDHALAILRVRNTGSAIALVPTAVAVVLFTGAATGSLPAPTHWHWALVALAVAVLAAWAAVSASIARARPAATPTVAVAESEAPALHGLIHDLADRLDVPAPGGIALTPDCDSWLEEPPGPPHRDGPLLVIGSPFLWWMRVPELRALLAPVVAGTGPSRHPDIAAARRCLRGLDAAAARGAGAPWTRHPLLAASGAAARLLLRRTGGHAAEMERGVAAAASARARGLDPGPRAVAQEQVGLAYAGWDRLLTRVAAPAWRLGRWPTHLNAGVVSALTELSQRDRFAEGFAARLADRPACDLLEDPGAVDAEVSVLAARLFHGPPPGPDGRWSPVEWTAYPREVVDRLWRERAARLFAALDDAATPTLSGVLSRLAGADPERTGELAARLGAAQARAAATAQAGPPGTPPHPFPLEPPRGGREALAEHVAAAVCCAALDSGGAAPGLDWLDGPVLLSDGARVGDLGRPVHSLVDDGDSGPLLAWLDDAGVRPDKLLRLV